MNALLELRGIVKHYQGLRPLRVRELEVPVGEVVSISGVDRMAAEMLVHLITGAMLPDEGEVHLFGQNTRSVTDSDAWLQSLDRVGIVTPRGVLIESFTLLQNIAMPFGLDVDPISAAILPQATAVAAEAGLDDRQWSRPAGVASGDAQMRAHLARAIALDPRLLIAEHPSAPIDRDAVRRFGVDLSAVVRRRGISLVTLTADDELIASLGGRWLRLHGATGELTPPSAMDRLKSVFR